MKILKENVKIEYILGKFISLENLFVRRDYVLRGAYIKIGKNICVKYVICDESYFRLFSYEVYE